MSPIKIFKLSIYLISALMLASCDDGDKGDIGDTGPQGVAGATGAMGATGADGADGVDGVDGVDGTDGTPAFVYDSPSSRSPELPAYSGAVEDYASILMLTVPSEGLYWVSLYTETWASINMSGPVPSLCAIFKNNSIREQATQNVNLHNIARALNLLGGDLIELRCASDTGGGFGMNSHGYLQKIQ
jgi:hypothetical protein